jgi:hypothetical protein
MQPLTAEEVLQLWERGERRRPAERAFAMLARACAGASADRLATMTVGESESALLKLRMATYGRHLQAIDDCPACSTTVEVEMDAVELIAASGDATADSAPDGGSHSKWVDVNVDGWQLQVAPPTVGDVLDVSGAADEARGRELLLERCVRDVRSPDGAASSALALPELVRDRVSEAIERQDAAAQLTTHLQCPDCKHGWDIVLDVGSYLWREIAASARRLLREVHELASRYGWSESAILRLSSARRHAYLEGTWT